jgi:hypothetical protein
MTNDILKKVFDHYGGAAALAYELNITRQAVWQWQAVPLKYVRKIEADTGIPREKLRPDIYA